MDKNMVRVIGVPMDLGQNRRGVDMGPSAIRYAGLHSKLKRLGYEVHDEGNVQVPNPEERIVVGSVRHLEAVAEACESIYCIGRQCVAQGDFALYLGGDHSISIGTVAAVSKDEPIGLIWIDAHGDFNTPETSPSGNIHGMPVAVLVGQGSKQLVDLGHPGPKVRPSDIVQIGIRDLDLPEKSRLTQSGVNVFTMRHIDEMSIASVTMKALEQLKHLKKIHVSLDMVLFSFCSTKKILKTY